MARTYYNPFEDEEEEEKATTPSTSEWGETVIAQVANDTYGTEHIREQIRTHDPEAPLEGFTYDGEPLPDEPILPVEGQQDEKKSMLPTEGYQVPTDESLAEATDNAFNMLRPGLKGSPLLSQIEWEDPKSTGSGNGAYGTPPSAKRTYYDAQGDVKTEKDDYGWGVKNALMRGLIRAGSLIDVAQGDAEEYAEGMRALKKYEVSPYDAKRLEELQESEGFWDAIGYYITNPALAFQIVAESLPMSAPSLVGGAVGMATMGPVGAAVGAGLGSFATEYLASIGDAMGEHGVDSTDAGQVRAAFGDEKFMETARAFATKRGIGVAAFDALSMGLAGRIYKPIKALAGKSTKIGGTVGGLSELLAQASTGAGGEGAAQIISTGGIHDKVALASEAIGDIVPGLGEIAINKARGKDASGESTDTAPPKDDLGDPADVTAAGDVADDTDVTYVDLPDTNVEDEGGSFKPTPEQTEVSAAAEEVKGTTEEVEDTKTSAPETETATTKQPKEAPDAPEAEPKEAVTSKKEDETPAAVESPLISAKELKPKVNKQLSGTPAEQKVIRTAWRKLSAAIVARYPNAGLKELKGRITGLGVGKFFQKLQEQVDITVDLPDLKGYLETVTEGTPAEIIQSLDRLTGVVTASIESTTVGAGGPILTQLRRVVNKFQASLKERAKKKGGGKSRHLIVHANEVGELAVGVRAAVKEAGELGVLDGIPSDINRTISAAITVFNNAQAPREVRTASGGKEKKVDRTSRAHLNKLGKKLLEVAEQLAEAIASREAGMSFDALNKSLAELDTLIGNTKGKGKATSSTTEAVTKEKKPTANEKVRAMAKAKKRSINEIAGDTADSLTYNELRRLAKHLGVSTTGNKDALIKAINNWESKAGVQVQSANEKVKATAKKKAAAKEPTANEKVKATVEEEPVNLKVKQLVTELNAAGISTTMSGDLYSDNIVYVDVEIPLESLEGVKLPPGWVADFPLAVRTKAHFDSTLDPEQKAYVMSDDFIASEKAADRERAELGIKDTITTYTDGKVTRLAKAGKKVTTGEILQLKEALKKAKKKAAASKVREDIIYSELDAMIAADEAANPTPPAAPTVKVKQRSGMSENASLNMDKLLELTEAGKIEELAFLFHSVGRAVEAASKSDQAKIAKALGAKDTVIENMFAAAYKIKTEARARKGKTNSLAGEQATANERVRATAKKKATTVTRKENMADTLKTPAEIAGEERIAGKLTEVLTAAAKVTDTTAITEESVDVTTALEGVTDTDLKQLTMPQLKALAEALGSKASNSKANTVKKIRAAAELIASVVNQDPSHPEVFNPEVTSPLSGSAGKLLAEDFEGGINEALEQSGVSKAAADKLLAIYKAVGESGAKKIRAATKEFMEHKDEIRLATEIAIIVGNTPSPEVHRTLIQFSNALQKKVDVGDSLREDIVAEYAAENDISLDEAEAFLEQSGTIESDEIDSWDNGATGAAQVDFQIAMENELGSVAREPNKAQLGLLQRLTGFFTNLIESGGLFGVSYLETSIVDKRALGEGLAVLKPLSMNDILDHLLKGLPKNSKFHVLANKLRSLNLQIPIRFFQDSMQFAKEEGVLGQYNSDLETSNRSIDIVFTPNDIPRMIMTMLHEMVHAATVARYYTDSKFKAHMDELYLQAFEAFVNGVAPAYRAEGQRLLDKMRKEGADAEGAQDSIHRWRKSLRLGGDPNVASFDVLQSYGIESPTEFISEAFTNPVFASFLAKQNLQLTSASDRARGPGVRKTHMTLLKEFVVAIVNRVLGKSRRSTLLQEVLQVGWNNFTTEADQKSRRDARNSRIASERAQWSPKDLPAWHPSNNAVTRITNYDKTLDVKVQKTSQRNKTLDVELSNRSDMGKVWDSIVDKAKTLPRTLNLGFMNRDHIERQYRDLFQRASKSMGMALSPLTIYVKAKQASSRVAREFEKKALAVIMRATRLDGKTKAKMLALARDLTVAQVWGNKSLKHKDNAHLWGVTHKKTGVKKMLPSTEQRSKEARQAFLDLHKESPEAAAILIDMAMLTKEIQNAKQSALMKALGETYDLTGEKITALANAKNDDQINAAFPRIDDDTLAQLQPNKKDSTEDAKKKAKELEDAKNQNRINSAAKKIIYGTSIKGPYFPLRRYGDYVVATVDEDSGDKKYVSFHSTRAEASRISKKLNKNGENTIVSKKIQSNATSKDLTGVAAEIMSKFKGSDADGMRSRLKTAIIETMAEKASHASQLKRLNIDGVAGNDMGRAFEEYVQVSKHSIGDIENSHEIERALIDMKTLSAKAGISEDDRIILGDVVGELAKQNKEDANDRDMSKLQSAVGVIGFFNFLGAPSYWILNATQTYTVTMPYVAAKWGMVKGPRALLKAQATVLAAARAAMKSGNPSYESFKANLPAEAQLIVKRLEDSVILQSTIAHEFGDVLSASTIDKMVNSLGPVGRAASMGLKAMEKIPEAVEHYNRISTALAIYSLSGDMVAVEDGVQATQFNYDSGNRARLLKALPLPAGGAARAIVTPVMMFKTYGIGMSRLLYGSLISAVIKKEGRAEALKLAGGLIVSHTVFGGIAGGFMLAPISMLIGAFNMAFREIGDEFDPEEAVEEFFRDLGWDAIAVMARRGLPASWLGIDMSKSINLGNLIWMGNDRTDFSEAGGVETGLTTMLGPVAQYAVTSVREGHRLVTGDNRGNWADFLAAVIPLKLSRGIIKGGVYNFQGLKTDSDLQFLDADQLSSWGRMAMGFRTTEVSSAMDDFYGEIAKTNRRNARKSQLIEQLLRATPADYAGIQREIDSFNDSLEKRRDRITRGDRARLQSRRRSRQRKWDREHPR